MTVTARQVPASTPADVLLLPLACGACGGQRLRQRSHGEGGTRRTWTGRCASCGTDTVVVVDTITIRPGGRSFEA